MLHAEVAETPWREGSRYEAEDVFIQRSVTYRGPLKGITGDIQGYTGFRVALQTPSRSLVYGSFIVLGSGLLKDIQGFRVCEFGVYGAVL